MASRPHQSILFQTGHGKKPVHTCVILMIHGIGCMLDRLKRDCELHRSKSHRRRLHLMSAAHYPRWRREALHSRLEPRHLAWKKQLLTDAESGFRGLALWLGRPRRSRSFSRGGLLGCSNAGASHSVHSSLIIAQPIAPGHRCFQRCKRLHQGSRVRAEDL